MGIYIQKPQSGTHLLRYCGDVLRIRLESSRPIADQAYFRTNLGNGPLCRQEIIEQVERSRSESFQAWYNIPMKRLDEFTFTLDLMLHEEGHFEGKCFTAQNGDPGSGTRFVEGENIHINVESAAYCCANGVYCAFVRQFGENKYKEYSTLPDGVSQGDLDLLDKHDYSVIPPSGTFRDLSKELPHIFDKLKCRILHLLPVHPTPAVYGRMGRFGSPYAALDFSAVNLELAEFDKTSTALDQFRDLADAVHGKGGKLFIDIAINHTGWGAKLHETHPEWFVKEPSGEYHSPGAWGVTWGDLTELDHSKVELWQYLAGIFRLWCTRGVDGFRCDAGYMIPLEAWKYIIAKVREEFPATVFLLEGLGGDPAVTSELLNSGNMNWAYSELFQNYSRSQIEGYLKYAYNQSAGNGLMIHYAETHDNLRLAATSEEYAKMRTALSALTSVNGAFGFTNGVEFYAKEKIDVHENSALHWGNEHNQVEFIGKLNCILRHHAAFRNGALAECIDSGNENCLLLSRTAQDGSEPLLIAINLNTQESSLARWNINSAPFRSEKAFDLLSGKAIEFVRSAPSEYSLLLPGGGVFCFTEKRETLERLEALCSTPDEVHEVEQLLLQEAKAQTASILAHKNGSIVSPEGCTDLTEQALALLESPERFLKGLYGKEKEPPFVVWNYPEDLHREVMIPPSHYILVKSPERIRAALEIRGRIHSCSGTLRDGQGNYFLLVDPLEAPENALRGKLWCGVFSQNGELTRNCSPVLYLPEEVRQVRIGAEYALLKKEFLRFMCANERGTLLYLPVDAGALRSRYDGVMLANLSDSYPENRHIMLRRLRIFCICDTKSVFLTKDCLKDFHQESSGAGVWHYEVPAGNGQFTDLAVRLELCEGKNAVKLTVQRLCAAGQERRVSDQTPVRILIRPDVEDRDFHSCTKASAGPEQFWPSGVHTSEKECRFQPAQDRILVLASDKGNFVRADEWQYALYHEEEASRGLDAYSDLFSPGYFETSLHGNDTFVVTGQILREESEEQIGREAHAVTGTYRNSGELEKVMLQSLKQYIVKRDDCKTVIAGYPWFLDWGRDTLIVCRGLIAHESFRQDVKKILEKFSAFVQQGTIPNMICGNDAANRDTSDAPLWLFTACEDLCRAEGNMDFLDTVLPNGKSIRTSLTELAEGIREGTPNGICCHKETSLVFSPSHFTWMDTNYPAGTPREGYPVEIQALWFAAQRFLSSILEGEQSVLWKERAELTARSIQQYFVLENGYLADCLLCQSNIPPSGAEAADHLRPNQLYAITLGAVTDPALCRSILEHCSALLIPGAIRSLADRDVSTLLAVYGPGNRLLNEPSHPYKGHYEGDEDSSRKVAYHNGTAWTWQFPAYCEAFVRVYGPGSVRSANALLCSMALQMDHGCLGHICEIADGDVPHTLRGCSAQAWGLSEFYRVWKLFHGSK